MKLLANALSRMLPTPALDYDRSARLILETLSRHGKLNIRVLTGAQIDRVSPVDGLWWDSERSTSAP